MPPAGIIHRLRSLAAPPGGSFCSPAELSPKNPRRYALLKLIFCLLYHVLGAKILEFLPKTFLLTFITYRSLLRLSLWGMGKGVQARSPVFQMPQVDFADLQMPGRHLGTLFIEQVSGCKTSKEKSRVKERRHSSDEFLWVIDPVAWEDWPLHL